MKKAKLLLPVLALLVTMSACKTQYDLILNSNDVDLKYNAAFDYYNQGKYTKAAELFESLSVLAGNTERADTIQYYWGLSNYSAHDYYTAETNFSTFVNTYPYSPLTPSAAFLRIDCLYRATLRYELDQKPTYAAISAISAYLIDNPDSPNTEVCLHMLQELGERLDKKAYENARLYYKMEDYKAARVAFKNILRDDADNIYREDILYYSAMSSYNYALNSVTAKQKERYLTFVDDYLNFVGEYPESHYRRELDRLYNRVKELI